MVGYLIGIDQGTTNTKAVVIDERGAILGRVARPIAVATPEPGWVEQDPESMFDNVVACVRELLETHDIAAADVVGLGIANQTETLVLWDRDTGRAVHPAIVWQCRRSSGEAAALDQPETVRLIRQRTGLDLDPTFTATKLKWISNHRPEIARGLEAGNVLFGTVDSWLAWKLTNGRTYASESGNAARTMLFRIDRPGWDDELFELFELSIRERPQILPSTGPFGTTERNLFGADIPITALLGDQQAALFGHGCFAEGEIKITYGTGAFVWANAGADYSPATGTGFLQTVAWHLDRPTYALEGFIMYAGAILDWLAGNLGLGVSAPDIERMASEIGDAQEVFLVPAFQGLASPWWRPDARAAIFGMSGGTDRRHLCHAGLEAICFQVRRVLDAMTGATGAEFHEIRIDGGLSQSRYFVQLQADILGRPLSRAAEGDITPLGAALMAGLGAGVWDGPAAIRPLIRSGATVEPSPSADGRWDRRYERWLGAVETTLAWSSGP